MTYAITLSENQPWYYTAAITVTVPGTSSLIILQNADHIHTSYTGGNGVWHLVFTPDANYYGDGGDLVYKLYTSALGGATFVTDLHFTVAHVPQSPSDILISKNTVNEHTPGAYVGTLSSVEPDHAAATFSYQILSDPSGLFELRGYDVFLRQGASADYNTSHADNILVRVTNNNGLTFDKTLTINIANVNDPPTITSNGGGDNATVSIPENTTAVTTVHATDPDVGTNLVYSTVGGADQAQFTINSATGALSFVAPPDYEAPADSDHNNSYVVVVRASDGTLSDDQTITVNVADVAEAVNAGSVSIGDVSIVEGNGGTSVMNFTVTRTGGTAAFDVNFVTADGTATVADNDYVANGGTLHFASGVNTQTVSVVINGDLKIEPNETFAVNLSGATNGATIGHGQGVGTILNDDQATPNNHAISDDFGGDGKSDTLWHNDNGAVSIWDNGQIGGGHVIANAGAVASSWHIAGTGDFDGNGHSDILWQNDNCAVSIWDNGQIGGAHIIASAGTVSSSWHLAGTGDFDGNGHDDILWRNDNGAVSIWDNGQIGGAHIVANAGTVSSSWHIAGTGDFDGNGHSDILWQNDNGAVSIWDNGQIGGAHIISGANGVASSWHIAGTGDFDGNGHTDILWHNDNGAVSIWDNGQIGGAHIISGANGIASSWHIAGTGDFDGNGHSDILWRNDNGMVSIWDNGQIGAAHVVANAGAMLSDWHIA